MINKGNMGIQILIIFLIMININSCTMSSSDSKILDIKYFSPCWLNDHTIAYASFEQMFLHNSTGIDYLYEYKRLTVNTYNLMTTEDVEICQYRWTENEQSREISELYYQNDTVYARMDSTIYFCSQSGEFIEASFNRYLNGNNFIKFTDNGNSVLNADSIGLYCFNRISLQNQFILPSPDPSLTVNNFFATNAGTLIVAGKNIYMLKDSFVQLKQSVWDDVLRIGLGLEILTNMYISNYSTYNYYSNNGDEILEFSASNTANTFHIADRGLCKLNIVQWNSDTIRFFVSLEGKRSPYLDKFVGQKEKSFYIIDSLDYIYLYKE